MIKRIGLYTGLASAMIIAFATPFSGLSSIGHLTLAIAVLMAIWWATEAIPIPVTALLPIILFPALGINDMNKTTAPYGHPLIFLFLGGFILAIALEKWHLHKRIALLILNKTTSSTAAIIGGFIIVSSALSMWVTNTATTMMLIPIALSVVDLVAHKEDPQANHTLCVALLLAIAYAASIGGMATLIGTVPNTILAGFLSEQAKINITFIDWMKVGLPLVLILLPLLWLLLTRALFKIRDLPISTGKAHLQKLLSDLGPMTIEEKRTLIIFVMTAFLWTFKGLLSEYLLKFNLSDTGVAIFAAFLLFLVPGEQGKLLEWSDTRSLPWNLLLMFGGGLTLAAAIQSNGVSAWIGELVGRQHHWPPLAAVFLITTITIFVTELTSNTATTATFLPIMYPIAETLNIHPLLLLFPTTFAASCAFMLPVATPPNGIIFGTERVQIKEMIRAGLWLNIIATFVISLLLYYLIPIVLI